MCPVPRDRCTCECHQPGTHVLHCLPCCSTCPTCQRRIVTGRMAEHRVRCDRTRLDNGLTAREVPPTWNRDREE